MQWVDIFEELLRRFSEMSNETSGEHYTPRDVVSLLVSLVFSPDKEKLQTQEVKSFRFMTLVVVLVEC